MKPLKDTPSPLSEVAGSSDTSSRRPVVFFVDDDDGARTATSRLLREHGYEVLEAASAEEAGRLMDGFTDAIDVLLMDIVLPDGWGATLAHRLRASHPEMAVVYTTGHAVNDPVLSGALNDAPFVVRKPFTVPGILEVLREARRRGIREDD
jgi:DNA-binding response OmpR family regulator